MEIEDYKTQIHKFVDEIMELNLIIQIYTVSKILYHKWREG